MDVQKLNKLKKKCEKRGKHFWRDAGKNLPGDKISRCDCCHLALMETG
jgi:hypothetical protein